MGNKPVNKQTYPGLFVADLKGGLNPKDQDVIDSFFAVNDFEKIVKPISQCDAVVHILKKYDISFPADNMDVASWIDDTPKEPLQEFVVLLRQLRADLDAEEGKAKH